jgi:hypothetical protein
VIPTIAICLAILLAVPILAFAMIFAVGCACGVASYHLSRQVVVAYQPMRKAFDPNKEKSKAIAAAQKVAQEAAEMQKAYFDGIQLTREQFVARENGK